MRILILCEGNAETWDSWSGSSRSLVQNLRAAGHTVTCGDVDLQGLDKAMTALRTFSPTRRRWWVRYHLGAHGFEARSRRAQKILDEHLDNVDVVLQIGATFQVRRPSELPCVLYCDSNIELALEGSESGYSEAAFLSRADWEGVRRREADVYRKVTHIFTMSDRVKRSFAGSFGIDESCLETIYAGPNFGDVPPPPPPRRDGDGAPVVLFIGRDFQRKGGDVMLEAIRRVRSRIPEVQLIMIGPERPPEAAADEVGVERLGFLDKQTTEGRAALLDAYARAKVFCLPTRFEPFGVVFLEAMYYELPCVGPRAWAIPEIIDEDVTGLLVTPEDPEALADALVELLRNPQRAVKMGQAGKRRLEERFTWERVVERMSRSLTPMVAARHAAGDA